MKRLFFRFLPIGASWSVAVSALAWNDMGHMTVAAIAESQLNKSVRDKIAALVRVGATDKTNTFVTAGCYPDDFKSDTDRHWHFTNLHFRMDGLPTANKPLEENVVWAIKRFKGVLKNRSATPVARADALRYLIHFIGDVHQPLHNVARDSRRFPTGDRGGNDFAIPPIVGWGDRPIQNLHILWDFGCGEFRSIDRPLRSGELRSLRSLAERIQKEHPRYRLKAVSQRDPSNWSTDAAAIARRFVYLLPEKKVPSAAYLNQGRAIARKQVALAGYRLADLLNDCLR